tara:strand:- start:12553 stop:12780 length:228 start_codon:yes stop_codon:yes gene_type:complete
MVKEKEWVLLQDELPRIGSGYRQLDVTYGRKWVHVTHTPIPGYQPINYKIKISKWNNIMSVMGKYRKRNNIKEKE